MSCKQEPINQKHGKMRQYNVGLPSERIAADIVESFSLTDDETDTMVIGDYFSLYYPKSKDYH